MRRDGFRTRNDIIAVAVMIILLTVLVRAVLAGGDDRDRLCIQNQHAIASALSVYLRDYDERFPRMVSTAAMEHALTPYLTPSASQNRFRCPATGNTPYVPNASLSGINAADMRRRYDEYFAEENVEILRDRRAHADGKLTVAFLDGHVERGGVAEEAEPNRLCVSHVRQVNLAITMYVQDYDEYLPTNMGNNFTLARQIFPYIKRNDVFLCPETKVPFIYNGRLSGKALAAFPEPKKVGVIADARPHKDGKSTVGFLDWHIERGGEVQPPSADGSPGYTCLGLAKQTARAMSMYIQDYDECLPPMYDREALETAVFPYVKLKDFLRCPETKRFYVLNEELDRQSLAQFPSPASTVTFQDTYPHRDRLRTYAFLDGHVKRLR